MSSKYIEIKYPMIDDVCKLMESPFTFDEFVEMELGIIYMFKWNMQIPLINEVLQTMLAQGVLYSSDMILMAQTDKENIH